MKRAILIASSTFPLDSTIEALQYPIADVLDLKEVLLAPDFGFEVETIINKSNSDTMLSLDEWASKAHHDDLVLIYFSGHGKVSRTGELF